jgi:hypothetical protein
MKKIYGHHAFYFVEGYSKVGGEQFVFAKKIVGKPYEQHKSCNKKISTIENLFKLTQNIIDTMRFQIIQKK